MTQIKITAKFVENIKPTGHRQEYCDTILKGFGLRVTKEGKKSFYVRPRYRNKTKRITLGAYPILSLADARTLACEKMTQAMNGSLHSTQTNSHTIKEAYARFIELYAKVHNKDWARSDSRLKKFMAEYEEVNLTDLHKRDIIAHLDKLMAAGTPMQANRAHSALSRFLNWCVERDYIEHSPCHGVKKPAKENKRDRILTDNELVSVWNVCGKFGYPFEPLLKLLILTAQRRGEVSGMRWSELDFKKKVWTIPKERTKKSRAHTVPLSEAVIKILETLPRFLHSDFVFTTTGKTPVSGHGKYKKRIDKATGVTGWVFHDLRRTGASRMAQIEVDPYVVEKVINHTSGTFSGVLGVYQQYGYDKEKREALNKWAEYVIGLTNGKRQVDRSG